MAELNEIINAAEKLGQLVATHPAVARYKAAQKSLQDDPDASRMMAEFGRTLEALSRQEQSGMPVSDAQRLQLEAVQTKIASHLKVKALNIAEVDFTDLLRKISTAWQKPLSDGVGGAAGAGGAGSAGAPSRLIQH